MTETTNLPILALVRDLMFSARIVAEARAAGVECKVVRDPAKIPIKGRLLIVDLNLDGAIDAAAAWEAAGNGPVVGFVSHVDTETVSRARSAGLSQILARSRFVQVLPDLIKTAPPA
jgi:hypothetical protein